MLLTGKTVNVIDKKGPAALQAPRAVTLINPGDEDGRIKAPTPGSR